MKAMPFEQDRTKGFALVVTLSLMILLTVIAVGLLSLSSISLRRSGLESSDSIAKANARLALMLALGELQKCTGDDRRITVDASIADGASNPNIVGVWKSWSPRLVTNPTAVPDYQTEKDKQFVGWLVSSGTPADLAGKDWAKSATLPNPVNLFALKSDGYLVAGSKVEVKKGSTAAGTMAWAVVQDATRAKINVAGPEIGNREGNDDLQSQSRPTLAYADTFRQPADQWNSRASKVISLSQAKLDTTLWNATTSIPEGLHFTAQGYGLLTDVVNGGLKTDLSLGFEMSEADFAKDSWGATKNPFRAANMPQFAASSSYRGERPLFRPLTDSGSVRVDLRFPPANTTQEFPAAAVPTFATLRSFYRTPYHVYQTADGPTIFERGMDHVALEQPSPSAGQFPAPGASPPASRSQTGYRPVLDRVLYVMSAGLSSTGEVRMIVTPIVTLWNPYNVALEIEGAVAYPWVDFPMRHNWKFYKGNLLVKEEQTYRGGHGFGAMFSSQFPTTSRTVNPYFFAAMTPGGGKNVGSGQSIRFAPGEVRVFAPMETVTQDYSPNASIKDRTLYLRPVDNSSQFTLKGGFSVPTYNPVRNAGFTRVLGNTESVEVSIVLMDDKTDSGNYWNTPFNVGLEDSTRLKLANPTDADRGQSIGDVQTVNFISSGAATGFKSPRMSYLEMSNPNLRKPFGMFETYHRVAADAAISRRSDLLFTTNPRQSFLNSYLTTGTFVSAPHYETKMRGLDSINQVMETKSGRSAYYGASNSAGTGRTHLSFFEVPRSPLLSLAGFQHADLAGTSYSPANQFGNSWASAYLKKSNAASLTPARGKTEGEATIKIDPLPTYDYSYLANESLWDSFFFSGVAPSLEPGSATGRPDVWTTNVAKVTKDYQSVLGDFIDDPVKNPLRNARMCLYQGDSPAADLKKELLKPEGCVQIASKLQVDGAFNINSTSEKAWIAFLGGMRNGKFDVDKDPSSSGGAAGQSADTTAFSRFRNPIGEENDNWMGFRSLSDSQLEVFARNMVVQIKKRGPFLSLGEFVNRRIVNSDLGLKGAIQAAIDDSNLNASAFYDEFDTQGYPSDGKANIVPANTGVGIPGYLTQADVLQSIAPVMTARSDTFTIRGYGEAKDASGKVLATAWCEAVVQRNPEFVDGSQVPHTAIADLNPTNQTFGRRYSIVSFRNLTKSEVGL